MLFRHGGGATKEIALRVPLAPAPGAHPATLLHSVFLWLELATCRPRTSSTVTGDAPSSRNGGAEATGESLPPDPEVPTMEFEGQARADAGISLLRLLCRWVHGCPTAVRELLENPANLFFVDVAAGKEEEGWGASAGEVSTGATAVQLASVKGLSCLLLGILLESVESASAPKSGGGGGEWTRDLIMKIIQNRVGERWTGMRGLSVTRSVWYIGWLPFTQIDGNWVLLCGTESPHDCRVYGRITTSWASVLGCPLGKTRATFFSMPFRLNLVN